MKKRMIIPLLCLYLMLGIIIMILLKNDYYVKERDYSLTTSVDNEVILNLTEERVFVFKNPLLHMENLILKFSGCENLADGWMYVRIFDEKQEYYRYEVPVYAFSSDEFYLYTQQIEGLEEGRNYKLSVKVTEAAAEKIKLHCVKDSLWETLLENDTTMKSSPIWGATGTETYSDFKVGQWIVIAVCMTLLYVCAVYLWCARKHTGPVLCLILLAITVGAATLYGDRIIVESSEEFWSGVQPKEFFHMPLQGGVKQSFVAEHAALQEIILFLDNYSPDEDGKVRIALTDDNGEEYYTWEAPVKALGGEVFCLMGRLEKELKKGDTYYICGSIPEGSSGITIQAIDNENARNSVDELLVSGEVSSKVLYLHQDYIRRDNLLLLWIIVLGIALAWSLVLTKAPKQIWGNGWYILSEVFLILTAYLNMELLSGNLRFVEMANGFKNCLLIAAVYYMLKAFLVRKAYYVVGILALLMGVANFYVLEFRGTELLYTDIKSFFTAMSVLSNYKFRFPPAIFTALLITACLFIMRILLTKKYSKIYEVKKEVVYRVSYLLAGMLIIFVMSNTLNRKEFDFFNLDNSFRKFGWYYTNLYLVKFSDVDKPKGYSEDEVERIIQEVAGKDREREEITAQNIIVIMNESLADLAALGELETNQDYMPYIRSLDENVVMGDLYVPTYGGGTSLTEYEFLTGNLQHFLPQSTVPYSSLRGETEEGICSTLKAQGYYTVAMHPYDPTNWERHKVYPAMKFDEFVALEEYEDAELIRNFVSDKACYDKIIEYYESVERDGGFFCFNVTMQNHGGYDSSNGTLDEKITIQNFESQQGETYLSLIYESDKAFAYLLEYFEQVEEPTMILMFGDHLPALPNEFYEDLYGKPVKELELGEKSDRFVTPYILWTNYDSDFQELPEMSVNYLGSYLLKCAGVKVPLYNQFLLDLQEEMPVLGVYGVKDEKGNWIKYSALDEDALLDYKMLQYMRLEDRESLLYSIFQSH